MEEVATVRFVDAESQELGCAIVRAAPDHVALALTLETDGDVEVVMPADACEELLDALAQAHRAASTAPGT